MPRSRTIPLLTVLTILALVTTSAAFGAGAIPNYTYLNDKAFRHGDIEEILPTLLKNVHLGGSEGLWGILKAILTFGMAGGLNGVRFGRTDVDRIYFGNWLRDYSQAMDIGGLGTFTEPTLLMIIRVLGFMTFGFATAEFEITSERLGVYLPVEHIDNPKGYAQKEGDARSFHPGLRPPVDPRELEINPHNGMKNYIATEGESWDTSSAHIRRTLRECIRLGRKSKGRDNPDQYEALRLLGTALHTLEDLTAHSNWCELALRKLGHADVYCHVGDEVIIDAPSGPAPPLVTGTFGSADFMHSVLGEGMDRLSEASMSNLSTKLNNAKSNAESHIPIIHSLLSEFLPSSHAHSQKIVQAEALQSQAMNLSLDDAAPQEVQDLLWKILEWRDRVYKDILGTIAMIPGLMELFEQLTEALNAFVFSLLDPFLKPVLEDLINTLHQRSNDVINSEEQYRIFTDPHDSDPSHSILAKDHFALIMNEPAGKVAKVVVEHAVNLVVKAWCEEREDPNATIDKILETFHHPYFASPNSGIQQKMLACMTRWLTSMHPDDRNKALHGLTKESVREGRNKRFTTREELEAQEEELQREMLRRQAEIAEAEREAKAKETTSAHSNQNDAGKARQIRYKVQRRPPMFERYDGPNRAHRNGPPGVIIEDDDEIPQPPKPPQHLPDTDEEEEDIYFTKRKGRKPHHFAPPLDDSHFRPASILFDVETGFQSAVGDAFVDWKIKRNSRKGKGKTIEEPSPSPGSPKNPAATFQRFDTAPRKKRPSVVDIFGYPLKQDGPSRSKKDRSPPPAFRLRYGPPPLYDDDEASSLYAPIQKGRYGKYR